MNKLKIDWLDSCPKCDSSVHTVESKDGTEEWLYSGDKVYCDCGQTGEIECDDGYAFVCWDKEESLKEMT